MVNGYKIERHDPLHRIIIGRLYHHLVRLLFRLRMRDVDCDFRLLRRRIFDYIELKEDSGVICVELMTKVHRAGFRIAEVPVHHYHRAYGKSQFFNVRRIARVARDLVRLWWQIVVRGEVGHRVGERERSVYPRGLAQSTADGGAATGR
jgi:hypothetical protein